MPLRLLPPKVGQLPSRTVELHAGGWRPVGQEAPNLYNGAWQKARVGFLAKHPLCVHCLEKGRTTQATVVDHTEPHRGNLAVFWDKSKWQALCTNCHSQWKQMQELGLTLP